MTEEQDEARGMLSARRLLVPISFTDTLPPKYHQDDMIFT